MATTSKSQIKASTKYNKENSITLCIRLNKTKDQDIIDILNSRKSKQGFIKYLIRSYKDIM